MICSNEDLSSYKDQSDEFYEDPLMYLNRNLEANVGNKTLKDPTEQQSGQKIVPHKKQSWPSHVIYFEALQPIMDQIFNGSNYDEVIYCHV